MPSAFHTFKLVPMAQPNSQQQPPPILPPSTPVNNSHPSPTQQQQSANGNINNNQQQQQQQQQQHDTPTSTPTTGTPMHPPSLPRSMMTPAREMRESSILSSAGSSARKPRQNLDEKDHILMLTHCLEQKGGFKEGTKSQYWTGVSTAFQRDTGKVLAQMSATVGRLVEARRRQIADWEAGVIPQKPGGELNDMLDQWMEFLKVEDGDAEAERMRQVDARRKVEEARKEARRQAIAAEAQAAANAPPPPNYPGVQPAPPMAQMGQPAPPQQQQQQVQQYAPHPPPQHMQHHPPPHQQDGQMIVANGNQHDMNGYRPHKRRRQNEPQQQFDQQQWDQHQYAVANVPEPPRRVVVEGALTKEDWRDIMGNDARLRAVENKIDKIELIVSQNNKLLLQLLQNQSKEKERTPEVEREEPVTDHLESEFERDYL